MELADDVVLPCCAGQEPGRAGKRTQSNFLYTAAEYCRCHAWASLVWGSGVGQSHRQRPWWCVAIGTTGGVPSASIGRGMTGDSTGTGDALRPALSLVPRQRKEGVPGKMRQNQCGCCRQMMSPSRSIAPLDHTRPHLAESGRVQVVGGFELRRAASVPTKIPATSVGPRDLVTEPQSRLLYFISSLFQICEFLRRDKGSRLSHSTMQFSSLLQHGKCWSVPSGLIRAA